MTLELIRSALGWCAVINIGFLFVWWGAFAFAADAIYRLHGRFFKLTREQYDGIHYTLMGAFKLGLILFNLVPYLALRIVG